MGLVTFNAVFKFLTFAMYFMAGQTIRLISVYFVTEGTRKSSVCRNVSINFRDLVGMTCVAGIFLTFSCQNNIEWLVRILMAGGTVGKREMRDISIVMAL